MATRHGRRPVSAAGADTDHIADAIDRHVQAQVTHPGHHQVTTGPVLVGERQAARPSAFDGADGRQILYAPQQAVTVDTEGRVLLGVHEG